MQRSIEEYPVAVIPASRRRVYIPGRKFLVGISAVVVPILFAVDLGSSALVRMSVPDDANDAARAGVAAIAFNQGPLTPSTAELAFTAAEDVAKLNRLDLDRQTFTVLADGSVQLSAHRTVPTVLFKHLPWFKDHLDVTSTTKASRASW
jgi:hypothetical protein